VIRKERSTNGRSADPEKPSRCPICGDVVGYRGRRQHLRVCLPKHGRAISDVEAVMPGFLPIDPSDAGSMEAWISRALDLRRRLVELKGLKVAQVTRDGIRARWESELAELEARIDQAGRGKP
jgi:hypothetical protein